MQDRFKYKIYDKKHNKMISSDEPLRILFNYEREEISFLEDFWREIPFNECEILQCTGLEDKNGKLIFEGHILKVFNSIMSENEIGNVVMSGLGCWSLKLGNLIIPIFEFIEGHLSIIHDVSKIEIIGNIYENPELLKEVQE